MDNILERFADLACVELELISYDDYLSRSQHAQAAYLSGLVRSTRSQSAVNALKLITEIENLDMTVYLAMKLSKGIWDINFPTQLFTSSFGTKGRDASNKSKDFERVDSLIEKYQMLCLDYTNNCVENCRCNYRREFKLV